MARIAEQASFEPTKRRVGKRKPKAPSRPSARSVRTTLVAFTIDAGTGRTVKVEGVDASGARHELSGAEEASLAKTGTGATLESVVEQAFEAGVSCLLGEAADEEATPESEEEAVLCRKLLRSLIGRSAARSLVRRDVLRRAIVRTLIEDAAGSRGPQSEGAVAH